LIVPHRPHIIRDLLDIRGVSPPKIMEIDAITIMVALARAEKGSTILPFAAVQESIDAGHVVAVPIEEDFSWEVSVCYSNLRPLSDASQVALRLIREEVRRLIESGKWPSARLPE
jgi:LysR family nitrogen assimilation transcriptional regulator